MTMSLLLQVLVTLFLVLIIHLVLRQSRTSAQRPRFLTENNCAEAPVVRNILPGGIERLLGLLFFKGDILDDFITPFYKKYGTTYVENALTRQIIFTEDPENAQAVLATKFKDFELGRLRRESLAPLVGRGIFTSDGEEWEHFRAIIRPQFSRAQVSDLEAAERHVKRIFKALPADHSGWTSEIDLSKAFVRFTLDTATEFLLGSSGDSMLGSIEDMTLTPDQRQPSSTSVLDSLVANIRFQVNNDDAQMDFVDAFNISVEDLSRRHEWQTLFGILGRRRFRKARDIVYSFVDHYVNEALHSEESPGQGDHKGDSVHTKKRYILLNELTTETQDPIELRNQVLHVLLGAKDTTAALLSWVFFLLPRNPMVFSRLRSEILSAFGPDDSMEEITFEGLKSVAYLQYVIKETLRLYPLVAMNSRTAARATVLPTGGGPDHDQPVAVMKDDLVVWSPYHMHRREDIWGSDAQEFKPERWENLKSGWFYLPFNGGPRTCPGQQYALTEAGFVIARFCQRFEKIESTDHQEKYKKGMSLVMKPDNGVRVRLYRRPSNDS